MFVSKAVILYQPASSRLYWKLDRICEKHREVIASQYEPKSVMPSIDQIRKFKPTASDLDAFEQLKKVYRREEQASNLGRTAHDNIKFLPKLPIVHEDPIPRPIPEQVREGKHGGVNELQGEVVRPEREFGTFFENENEARSPGQPRPTPSSVNRFVVKELQTARAEEIRRLKGDPAVQYIQTPKEVLTIEPPTPQEVIPLPAPKVEPIPLCPTCNVNPAQISPGHTFSCEECQLKKIRATQKSANERHKAYRTEYYRRKRALRKIEVPAS